MSVESARPDDYWSNEFEVGTSSTWVFEGVGGQTRLSGPVVVRATGPGRFRARLTRVQLDHVALEAFEATAHRAERTAATIATHPTPLLTFLLLLEGEMEVELGEPAFTLRAGECVVLDSRDPFRFSAEAPVRMLRSVVGTEHVPVALQQQGMTMPGALPRTSLTDSFIAFVASILRTTAAGQPARGAQLIQAVADLQVAVLAEAQQQSSRPLGPAGLRWRMEEFIEAHFTEADLTPAVLAAAFNISLRHAHFVFDDGPRTISRFIRDRRVSAVAHELRTRDDQVPFTYLAKHYGFGSADTLGRAFYQRFGMTMSDYRTGGHRSFG